ncbi:hypothetical protein R3P38DRAFT_3194232 [Favolaschia claudopus]|uniref:NYN domain-containing protein n=1 Tax=Favolaschia claudopus TaxID=2862362 RepID=A0AAW0BCB1_9AGAR
MLRLKSRVGLTVILVSHVSLTLFSPSGYEVVGSIRNVAHRFGPVKYFKAYMESSGVSLTDCPHNGRKNVADQMIIVDMLAYAMDHPAPATLILISGDRDFAYPVSILRLRQYDVVVVSLPLPGAHPSLKRQASVWLDWNREVLGITNPSSSLEATEESSTTRRNSFTFQSPSARRSSYLPTPETPSFRAFQLPQKNDTVVGTNKGPSFFGDLNSKVVSPETLEAEDVSLPQIPKAEPMLASSELAYRPPFCKERYKSQQYIPVPPLPEQINVRAVKSPIASPLGRSSRR